MQVLAEIHGASGINTQGRTIQRIAVRAVIFRGRKLLMVYSANVGDYKFPGGGVDVGETHEQALARELLEECGASLLSVDGELGAIVEYNIPMEKDFDVFKMTSYYYVCRIEDGNFGAQNWMIMKRTAAFNRCGSISIKPWKRTSHYLLHPLNGCVERSLRSIISNRTYSNKSGEDYDTSSCPNLSRRKSYTLPK